MEYTSIYCTSHSDFNKQLNDLTNEGWVPEGKVNMSYIHIPTLRTPSIVRFFLMLKRKTCKES